MALQVWLPLINNTNNQGLANWTFSNTNTTYITNVTGGKLGNCYKFASTASNSGIYAADNGFMAKYMNNESFTLMAWIKTSSTNNDTIIMGLSHGLLLYGGKTTSVHLYNSSRTIICTSSVSTNDGKWHHVAATYDIKDNSVKIYVDGVNTGSAQYPTGYTYASSWSNGLFIGRDPNNSTVNDHYLFNGMMNDVRIYNNALSQAEIKEISKGLIAHWKLDGEGGIGENYVKGSKYLINGVVGGVTKTENDYLGFTSATYDNSSGTSYHELLSWSSIITPQPNEQYTCSFFAKSPTSAAITLYLYNNTSGIIQVSKTEASTGATNTGADGNISVALTTGWKRYWVTWTFNSTTTVAAKTLLFRCLAGRGSISVCGVKLEKGNLATDYIPNYSNDANFSALYRDSSGYSRNLTEIDSTSCSISLKDSGRYNVATQFNGTTSGLSIQDSSFNNIFNDVWTISFWIYTSDENGARSVYFSSYNASPFWCIEKSVNNAIRYDWNGTVDQYGNNNKIMDGVWNHICLVKNSNTNCQSYINGVFDKTMSTSVSSLSFSNPVWRIGRDTRPSDGTPFKGYMADFRIYATALTVDDILNLYNLGIKIDNEQKIHSYQLTEGSSRELLARGKITSAYSNKNIPYLGYNSNGEIVFTSATTSVGSNYIKIYPTGHTYYYDFEVTKQTGNNFYVGFERYDEAKTSRSNNACVYVINDTVARDHYHYQGTVNLATDGVNPTDTITLRVLNGWSGSTSGANMNATIHSMSLREVDTLQTPKIYRNGSFLVDEFKEDQQASIYKSGIVESNNFVEI